jgi:hypothetical protein
VDCVAVSSYKLQPPLAKSGTGLGHALIIGGVRGNHSCIVGSRLTRRGNGSWKRSERGRIRLLHDAEAILAELELYIRRNYEHVNIFTCS